ncbi:MAG: serpin family protein [Clostridia bacterium]|nr:serpin family protein [Clostridia bacterium]
MKKISLTFISFLLLCAVLLHASGCSANIHAADLMDGVTPRKWETGTDPGEKSAEVTDFAIRLFRAVNEDGKNTLISPLSVLCALAMTANGAQGETRAQMESVLGMRTEDLNAYLCAYVNALPQGDRYKLHLANSIWFSDEDGFAVNRDFLQTNADYYGADIYQAPFDNRTLRDVNRWVRNETDGMIPEVLDRIPSEAVMYLVNALAFEAEWKKIYEKKQIKDGTFTKEDGTELTAKMMYATEHVKYLKDKNATGFFKYYNGEKYAFVALLPDEGVSLSDYVNSLDGAALHTLLSEAETASVSTAIPKFESEYSAELSEILQSMGMTLAFDENNADFSGIGTVASGNLFMSRVLHKTCIRVDEKGTKAGAVTVIEMSKNSADAGGIKQVYLDRPFVYMLVDCENNIPFFIGTVTDVNA